ncbi:MAG: hypothetical protein SOV71_06685 [Anaerovoracaceae bacterium]|nr:hypothetical protein [Bacillota bacterium]MDY2671223.1 hypothetical protein [Anaerovoracaceae bacterium]
MEKAWKIIKNFIRANPVFTIAGLTAMLSMIAVPPDGSYAEYICLCLPF